MIYINYIKLFYGIMYSIYAASTRPREYHRIHLRTLSKYRCGRAEAGHLRWQYLPKGSGFNSAA